MWHFVKSCRAIWHFSREIGCTVFADIDMTCPWFSCTQQNSIRPIVVRLAINSLNCRRLLYADKSGATSLSSHTSVKNMTENMKKRLKKKMKQIGEKKAKSEKDQSSTTTSLAGDSRQCDAEKRTDDVNVYDFNAFCLLAQRILWIKNEPLYSFP